MAVGVGIILVVGVLTGLSYLLAWQLGTWFIPVGGFATGVTTFLIGLYRSLGGM
jgi:hypothetical protein